jgi:hypothetical protein
LLLRYYIDNQSDACLKGDLFLVRTCAVGENMAKEIMLVELQTMAARSGLQLTDEELEKLLPGVNRSYNQILELRGLITDRTEPAAAFVASRTENR